MSRIEERKPEKELARRAGIVPLGNDAHIVLERQDACHSGPEDRLVVRENKSVHE